jgi:superfamily I DNA/RNA helicase
MGLELADVDGNSEERKSTISLFNGPPPTVQILDSIEQESVSISDWLKARTKEGIQPHEIAVFVRSAAELDRARAAAEAAGLPFKVLDER